jgi:hypothetical protein
LQNNNQLNYSIMLHTRKTILLGEGIHQHTLVGKFEMENDTIVKDFATIKVKETTMLEHEKPNGGWSGEHKTLVVEQGKWVMGSQVEYNPFNESVSRVWD